MQMRLCISVNLAASLLASTTVAAQIPPAPPRAQDIAPSTRNLDQVERESFMRHQLNNGRTVDRQALAERVAAFVDAGRCEDARREAREGGDRAMARQVSRICREGQPTAPTAPNAD